jgi:HSP20 family protein
MTMFNLIPWKKRSNGGNVSVRHDDDISYPMSRLRSDFDALWKRFEEDWNRGLTSWGGTGFGRWNSDLEDKENEYLFHAELPGFDADEIDVKVSGNTLTVRAEHKEEEQDKGYRYGSFQRYFTLPHGVDEGQIDARYHNGVLEVHLPKTEQAKGKRIPVTA